MIGYFECINGNKYEISEITEAGLGLAISRTPSFNVIERLNAVEELYEFCKVLALKKTTGLGKWLLQNHDIVTYRDVLVVKI